MTYRLSHRGYRVVAATGVDEGWVRNLVDSIIDQKLEPRHVFKSNARTYSALLDIDSQAVMLKVPRSRNHRKWERFLTLFRASEGIRTFNNLDHMQALGMNAPQPLIAAERRRFGVATDSFACYAFEHGRPAGPEDASDLLAALGRLHDLGYLRTDPQAANFLVSDRGIVFIDFRLKKPVVFARFRKRLELAKLARVYPGCRPYIPASISATTGFRMARRIESMLFRARQLKRSIRRRIMS
jgi:heptose II phosphotransferase